MEAEDSQLELQEVTEYPRQKALDYLKDIKAIMLMEQGASMEDVVRHLKSMPLHHRRGIQLMLVGTGYATEAMVPDGVVGQETENSLFNLKQATIED